MLHWNLCDFYDLKDFELLAFGLYVYLTIYILFKIKTVCILIYVEYVLNKLCLFIIHE